MRGWNQAPFPRDQILLFHETLADRIGEIHSVRLFAETLDGIDWSSWEQHCILVAGQPPIHPKIMAGAILYGLTHRLRSSRRLERACTAFNIRKLMIAMETLAPGRRSRPFESPRGVRARERGWQSQGAGVRQAGRQLQPGDTPKPTKLHGDGTRPGRVYGHRRNRQAP